MNVIAGWFFLGGSNSNNIAPAGAIDMVAVRDASYVPDASPAPTNPNKAIDPLMVAGQSPSPLQCSPFHLKFNEQCKKGEKKLIKITINGEETDVFMRLGLMGEAFFVERVRELHYDDVLDRDRNPHDTLGSTVVTQEPIKDDDSAVPILPLTEEALRKINE